MQYECRRSQSHNGFIFDADNLFIPQYLTAQECPGQTWEVTKHINKLPLLVLLHLDDAMFPSHAGVARDNRDIHAIGVLIPSSNHIVAQD